MQLDIRMARVLCAAVLVACIAACASAPGGHPLLLWQVAGEGNDVYLLGSVHLLRESDYPVPLAIAEAYEQADTLVMELDLDDIDQAATQQLVQELAHIRDGGSLESLLGPVAFKAASEHAERAQISLDALRHNDPWFAAITVEQIVLQRNGFDPSFGIENHLAAKALVDGKEILGLESMRQQLEILDNLPLPAQRTLLLQALEKSEILGRVMDELIRAWRYGDTAYLEATLLPEIRANPDLYDALVVRRNEAWLPQIEQLLAGSSDYLVVVGALHLIGPDGVPEMLRARGKTPLQLRQSPLQ